MALRRKMRTQQQLQPSAQAPQRPSHTGCLSWRLTDGRIAYCVVLGKLLNIPGPQFPHLSMGLISRPAPRAL